MKIGDLLIRRMDETSWLVLDLYFDHALMMSNKTGVRRWVFNEEWSQYDK
jgi:hypothetical protein